jgi:hypothetical protein
MELNMEGGCTYRQIRYRLIGTPLIVHACHCRWCQRETGTAHALNALYEADRVVHTAGEPEIVITPSASGRDPDLEAVDCIVHFGQLRDAILYSCGANAAHGLRRSNADKRQAATKLLKDEEWSHKGDSWIARHCNVHHELVARVREELKPVVTHLAETQDRPRTVRRGGSTYTMSTANIGGSRYPEPDPSPAQPEFPIVAPQAVRDVDNSFISAALWEIERRIDSLPTPIEAVAHFPTHHHHTFTAAKLHAMADWLATLRSVGRSWNKRCGRASRKR